MADELEWERTRVNYRPPSYTANSVDPIMNVEAGDLVGLIIARTTVAFNGSGTDAIFELGDDGDPDRFLDGGEIDETTAGSMARAIGASGGGYILYRNHLYTTANTIDVNFTANTSGTRNAGEVEITIWHTRVRPI